MKLPDPDEQPTMTVDEVAAAIGMGRSQTYDAVKRGEIPSIRVGSRKILVPTHALREWLGHRTGPVVAVPDAPPQLEDKGMRAMLAIMLDAQGDALKASAEALREDSA